MPSPASARVLLLSDTHVGFDLPARVPSGRRVRGRDFLDSFERALAPARRGEVDVVIHGGDVFDHPDPAPAVVDLAYGLLREVAARGVTVLVLPGNHERARFPCPLLIRHRGLLTFDAPRTHVVQVRGLRLAVGAFPYARRVRAAMPSLVERTGVLDVEADARLLVVHHCIEGACVSLPDGGSYTFRDASDVIATRDLPRGVAAVLSGHIHRHQVLPAQGERPCPVVYCGSVERTAFAEMRETKGFVTFEVAAGTGGGHLQALRFHPLPTRPMIRRRLQPEADLVAQVRAVVEEIPVDAILRLEMPGEPRPIDGLGAAQLRALAPATMNVFVAWDSREPPAARLSRARRRAPRRPDGSAP